MKGRLLRPLYFYALAGVVAVLVLVSGGLQVARTERELLSIYEGSARTLAESVERLVGQALTFLEISGDSATNAGRRFALDDILLEYLAGLATEMDRALLDRTPTQLEPTDREVSLQFFSQDEAKAQGGSFLADLVRSLERGARPVAIRRLKAGSLGGGRLLVAFRRHLGPGFLILTVRDEHRISLLKRLLVQDAVSVFRDRQDLLDLILVDENGHLLVRLQEETVSRVPAPDLVSPSNRGSHPEMVLARHGDTPALDFTRDLRFRNRRVGTVRVSVSVLAMERILAKSRRATLVLSGILLVVGFALVRLIFWRQERTLLRIRQMEEEIRRREELSALGEMAAGVAHEIRNPLNAISMGLQSLAMVGEVGSDSDDGHASELLETLRREVGRINRIVSEFLSLSRPISLELARVNPRELVDHVSGLLQQAAAGQQVEVRVELSGSEGYVSGDQDKLTQALLNLGINALEACNEQGEVTLRLVCQKNRARIEVSDTGPGVTPENQTHLFRPHFTTKEKGLGLGLFIAQRIVQTHGGTLTLGHSSSRGTTMVITLPLVQD